MQFSKGFLAKRKGYKLDLFSSLLDEKTEPKSVVYFKTLKTCSLKTSCSGVMDIWTLQILSASHLLKVAIREGNQVLVVWHQEIL